MSHCVTYAVVNPPPGSRPVCLTLTYSDADYAAMFSGADRDILDAGGMVIAKADPNCAWIGDVGISLAKAAR